MTKPWKKDGSSSADERAPVSDGTSPAPAAVPRAARPASASKNALLFLAVLFALGPAIFVYELVFPDFPAPVARGDAAALRELFYSGAPAIVLCENRTRVAHNVALDKVGPAIKQAARLVAADIGLGAELKTFRLDCSQEAPAPAGGEPTGQDIYARFGVQRWLPALFVVGNGMRPGQLSPAASVNATELAREVRRMPMLQTKHTRLDNDKDLHDCLLERSGGCVVLYTSREGKDVAAELKGAIEARRTVLFATLKASSLAFSSTNEAVKAIVKGAANAAKDEAAASGVEGAKGTVLVLAKRVPAQLNNGVSGSFVVVARAAASSAAVKPEDVERVLADGERALAKLAQLGETAGVDALLERDDLLAAVNASIVTRGELRIVRAAQRAAAGAGAGAGADEFEEDKFAEQLRRREERNERRERAAEQAEREAASLTPEQRARRERERRAQMDAEEQESAHVAHAAGDDGEDGDGEDADGGFGGAGEGAEEVVDLDDDSGDFGPDL